MSWVTSSAMLTPSTAVSGEETSVEMAHRELRSRGRAMERGTRNDRGQTCLRKPAFGFAERTKRDEEDGDDDDDGDGDEGEASLNVLLCKDAITIAKPAS